MKASSYLRFGFSALLFSAALCGNALAQRNADAPVLVASVANDALPLPVAATPDDSLLNPGDSTVSPSYSSSAALPDAPSAMMHTEHLSPSMFYVQSQSLGTAPLHDKTIPAGWKAQPLTAKDKMIVGAKDLYSPMNFLSMAASAGYSHLTNGSPNYGTNSEAFAKRFGAAAVRETSQGVFTDIIFSPLLHEDPRYYVKGSQYGFFNRTMYAITRTFITRTDSGNSSINGALLLGYAGAAALTPAYYPQINRNFHDTASTYGGSIGGAALGFFVTEFSSDFLQAIHLKKK